MGRRDVARYVLALGVASAAAAAPANAGGGSLRGSRGSVDRMYEYAVDRDLGFVRTASGARAAVAGGRFVPLPTSGPYVHYLIDGVEYPYALPATIDFIQRFAASYRNGCGERLVVTSALRPKSEQPRNSSPKSVHPTGIAVDLRKPSGRCLAWLRGALLTLEREGVIEATEEFHPAHMHVAVFGDRWGKYVRGELSPTPAQLAAGAAPAARAAAPTPGATSVAARPVTKAKARAKPAAARRYTVRRGDSLWSIARRHGTTVARLKAVNSLRSSTVRPGRRLVIPS
jgi:LysM repeat protein